MARDEAAMAAGLALVGSQGDAPADEAKAKLTRLSGSEFDAAYIEREVGYHQAVLDAIDGLLIPTTENAELKQLLQTVRPAIVAHLERARGIQRELAQQ